MSYLQSFTFALIIITLFEKVNLYESKSLESPEWIEHTTNKTQDFPLDFVQVVSDASNVFGKIVNNMISKKRLLGIDNWYW